jgi:hypothetical protein
MKPAAAFKTILLLGCGFALGIWYQERSADRGSISPQVRRHAIR